MKAEPKSLKTGRINFLCWSKVRLTHTGAKHQFEITEVIWGQKRPMRSFEAKLTFWTKIGLLPQCVPSGMDHWISSRSNYPVADGTIWPWKGLLLRGHRGLSKVQIGLFLPYLLSASRSKCPKKFFFLFQFSNSFLLLILPNSLIYHILSVVQSSILSHFQFGKVRLLN